jgi:U3 small nucleolar ribonucleoprotein protein IMP3
MVRKLKFHEQKLLRKHDFVNYKQDNNHRDHDVARRYMIQKPEDYVRFLTILYAEEYFANGEIAQV